MVAMYLNRRVWNYGLVSYDRPNVLTINFLYDVPRLSRVLPNPLVKAVFDGWQISNITSFIPGSPMTVSMSANPAVNFTGGGDGARPIMVGNPNLSGSDRTFYQWFNVAAFAEPLQYSKGVCPASGCPPLSIDNIGNMTQYPIRGPGRNTWNTSVFKNFRIKERLNCQFRAEAYNTFNHTQYSGVDNAIQFNAAGVNTRASSGNITSARDPRIMQFAMRIIF